MLKLFSGYLSLFESPLTSRVLPRLFRCALELCFCQDRCFWSFACGVVVGLGEGGNTRAHVRELDGWAGGEAEWDEYTLGFYLYCIHGCVLLPISVYTGVIQIILHPWNNRWTVGAFCAREVLPEIYTEIIPPQRQTLLKLRCPVSGRHHSPARRTHNCPSRRCPAPLPIRCPSRLMIDIDSSSEHHGRPFRCKQHHGRP